MRVTRLYSPDGDSGSSGTVNPDPSTDVKDTPATTADPSVDPTPKQKKTVSERIKEVRSQSRAEAEAEQRQAVIDRLEARGYDPGDDPFATLESVLDGTAKKRDDNEKKRQEEAKAKQREVDEELISSVIESAFERFEDDLINPSKALKLFRSEYTFRRTKDGVRVYDESNALVTDDDGKPITVKAARDAFLKENDFLMKAKKIDGPNGGSEKGGKGGGKTTLTRADMRAGKFDNDKMIKGEYEIVD